MAYFAHDFANALDTSRFWPDQTTIRWTSSGFGNVGACDVNAAQYGIMKSNDWQEIFTGA
jgi:hypothetical protein